MKHFTEKSDFQEKLKESPLERENSQKRTNEKIPRNISLYSITCITIARVIFTDSVILRVLFFSSTADGETALILPESFLFFLFRMLEQQTFGLQLFHYILVKSSTILMASSTETPTLPPPPLGSVLWSPDHCFLVSSSAEDWKDE